MLNIFELARLEVGPLGSVLDVPVMAARAIKDNPASRTNKNGAVKTMKRNLVVTNFIRDLFENLSIGLRERDGYGD